MAKYIVKRLILMVFLLLGMTFIVFASLYLTPGDPAEIMAGANATPADIEAIRIAFGLDKPFFVQYFTYLGNLLQGNLGMSLMSRQPIIDEIKIRFPNTLNLAVASMIVAILIGIPSGMISAIKKDKLTDNVITTMSIAGISIPNFLLGVILILVFSVQFKIFPSGGMTEPFFTPLGFKQAVLPSLALGLGVAATFTRIGRSSMLDVLQSDYIRTARSKGVSEPKVIVIHALRNALIPIITVFGTSFGGLLGGAMITEKVFAINGIGTYLITAISQRNFPVVQSTVLIIAAIFIFVNIIVDLLYVVIDPRISYE